MDGWGCGVGLLAGLVEGKRDEDSRALVRRPAPLEPRTYANQEAGLGNAQFGSAALAGLHDDFDIVPQSDQEAHQALDRIPPELA